MKALDKVFDTQVITGIIGDKFHSLKQENFLYEEGKKTKARKDGYQRSYIVTEENQQEFIKEVKVNGTLVMYQRFTSYMIQLILENLTGKF